VCPGRTAERPPGTSLPISDFYIATPSSTVSQINAALSAGQDLLFTPGVYQINGTIDVTTLTPSCSAWAWPRWCPTAATRSCPPRTSTASGSADLIFDAGSTNSNELIQIGPSGSSASHASDPTVLSDIFARIGGATVGKATQTLQINSANVIGDDFWLWRADHGNGGTVGWTTNTAANGLVVNGANVTMYGLAVEHYQAVQVQWNGNGGADYFYQSEMPYDPPNQSSWMDGSSDGYPSINVSSSVTSLQGLRNGRLLLLQHELGCGQRQRDHRAELVWREVHDLVTVSLGGVGTISTSSTVSVAP
jgi:hypothetical protein